MGISKEYISGLSPLGVSLFKDIRTEDEISSTFQGVKILSSSPKIITLCGSSRFCEQMAILAWELEKQGAIVFGLHYLPTGYCLDKGYVPDDEGCIHHIGEQEKVEDIMDSLHLKKIEMSNAIFVVNVGGYIGTSTRREIEYAKLLGREIIYLEN